jgi:hypothetical protein
VPCGSDGCSAGQVDAEDGVIDLLGATGVARQDLAPELPLRTVRRDQPTPGPVKSLAPGRRRDLPQLRAAVVASPGP